MPQHSARQKRLTTLQEAQQSLDLQVYLNMLQIAIKQVHDDDTDSQSDSMHSPHPDGLSSDVEMSSSLSSAEFHSTSTSTSTNTSSESAESEFNSSSDTNTSDSMSDGSLFGDLNNLGPLMDFQRFTTVLEDEVKKARVLNKLPPPARNPQIQLLDEWKLDHPRLFQRKLRVSYEVFVEILMKIQNHMAFGSNPSSPQLPVSIQLAIFLNAAGYYGNAATSQDMAEWAGVSVGTVHNCYK